MRFKKRTTNRVRNATSIPVVSPNPFVNFGTHLVLLEDAVIYSGLFLMQDHVAHTWKAAHETPPGAGSAPFSFQCSPEEVLRGKCSHVLKILLLARIVMVSLPGQPSLIEILSLCHLQQASAPPTSAKSISSANRRIPVEKSILSAYIQTCVHYLESHQRCYSSLYAQQHRWSLPLLPPEFSPLSLLRSSLSKLTP